MKFGYYFKRRKPTLNDIRRIISELDSEGKGKLKPANDEIQLWINTSQIEDSE
jgi:hypothetical protein